jgi:SPP1 family phage portal protein
MPFWKSDEHDELDFAVRVYKSDGYEGRKSVEYTYVELYDTNGITRFTAKKDYSGSITDLIPDYSTYHFELDVDEQFIGYNWNKCPLIAFRASANELPLIKKVKPLQDALNKIISDFTNIMEENASGNSIIVLKNYAGTDLGEFRRNLAQYRAVKVKSGGDVGDGGIDTLEIEVNKDNYDTVIKLFRKAIIQNMAGYDYDDLKSSGSPNEMSIKAIFSQIDLSANSLETEFQASFEELLWFINQHLINTNQGNYVDTDITVIFNRDLMISESQIISDIKNSVGLISNKTLISMHPYVSDVEAEEAQMKKEAEENVKKTLPTVADNTPDNTAEITPAAEEKENE